MSAIKKPSLVDNFKALPSGTRNGIILGLVVLGMFVYGTMNDTGPKTKVKNKEQRDSFSVANPGSTQATEGIASGLSVAEKKQKDLEQQIELLKLQNKQIIEGSSIDGKWNDIAALTAQVQELKQRLDSGNVPAAKPDATGATGAAPGSLNLPLPPPPMGHSGTEQVTAPPASSGPNSQQREIQVIGNDASSPGLVSAKQRTEVIANIPGGSSFEAVLLNGMDASTAMSANKTPSPAVLRIKTDAILPSLYKYDLKECLVLVGGYGNMSSERVEMRTETMSCINERGEVYEGKIEAYVVGEDGKVGARGRLVSKQGTLLAKSFLAGLASGIGSAFTPQPVQSLNIAGGTEQPYQYPTGDQIIGSGVGKGMNQAGSQLAAYYLKVAEQLFPIVELDSGRKMTIVVLKGFDLKMDKKPT
ncbi:TraB/VirB10 family protein [Rhodoferax antarcticus]|uniref:TraB pilus assembly family protein n=1 Tax=Rhodoferax antarcticus ANT.BR TaxID=1111071 RepID=A0A1Q8Y9F6_9BURK|nr:TraB/VirB10 family protein [Rhodoferax antarcticus]OLP04634.1 traB pilus assembly family protein [Rhodoferax antarcticus ANT.BR]